MSTKLVLIQSIVNFLINFQSVPSLASGEEVIDFVERLLAQ